MKKKKSNSVSASLLKPDDLLLYDAPFEEYDEEAGMERRVARVNRGSDGVQHWMAELRQMDFTMGEDD